MYVLNRTVDGSVRYVEKRYAAAASVFQDGGPQAGGNGLVNRGPHNTLITALKYKNSSSFYGSHQLFAFFALQHYRQMQFQKVANFVFEFPEYSFW